MAIANGGTGSSTQNFVDLSTTQTAAGNKTLSGNTILGGTLGVTGNISLGDDTNPFTISRVGKPTGDGTSLSVTGQSGHNNGGDLVLTGGVGGGNDGGNIVLAGGDGDNDPGQVLIQSNFAIAGRGYGDFTIKRSTLSSDNNGYAFNITGQDGAAGAYNGGDLVLSGGANGGTGNDGKVVITSNATAGGDAAFTFSRPTQGTNQNGTPFYITGQAAYPWYENNGGDLILAGGAKRVGATTAVDGKVIINSALQYNVGSSLDGKVLTSDASGNASWATQSSGWGLTGNEGTTATNFIGTTDDKALVFKVNNEKAGLVSSGTNTSFGYQTLNVNTGTWNTANGKWALLYNTTGLENTAIGSKALYTNTTGGQNTANGNEALYYNQTGSFNTANGNEALFSNLTGGRNTANGNQALYSNQTGWVNTAIGNEALYYNQTGWWNTAIGNQALFSNVTNFGSTAIGCKAMYYADNIATGGEYTYNTAVGFQALMGSPTAADNTGKKNTAIGDMALVSNTTGSNNTANGKSALHSNTTGSNNTANGLWALHWNTTGDSNTAIGGEALFYNRTGSYNTANGYSALGSNNIGSNNTGLGFEAGRYYTGGIANATSLQSVYLGASTRASAGGNTNEIVIGYDATGAGSNTATLGNTSITSTVLRGNVKHYGTTSGYVGLKSPATVATPYSLTLPTAAPASNGQVLSATTAGVMS